MNHNSQLRLIILISSLSAILIFIGFILIEINYIIGISRVDSSTNLIGVVLMIVGGVASVIGLYLISHVQLD